MCADRRAENRRIEAESLVVAMRFGKKDALVLCLLSLVAGTNLSAAEVPAYTLEQCLEIGLQNSAAALNARRDVEIGDAFIGQARADAFPQLRLTGDYRRLDEVQTMDFGDSSIELGTLDNYSLSAEVSQQLFSGGRTLSALRVARRARDMYEWSYAATRAALQQDIRTGFYAILLSRRVVTVREESVTQLEAHAQETERKQKAGTVSEFDMLSARVRLLNEKPALIAAHNAERLAVVTFQRLLNLEDETFSIAGELALLPVSETLANLLVVAVERRPELQELETVVLLRKQDMRLARAEGLPSLRAYFSYSGANSYQFASFEEDWQWHWNAGLSAEWDIWDGGLTSSQVREKRLELSKAQTSLLDLARTVRLDVRAAFLEMERALAAVQAGEGSLELAERALTIARSRYDAGLATNLEFTDSQLALNTAHLTRLQALHDHMTAVARLEYVCGLEPGALTGRRESND